MTNAQIIYPVASESNEQQALIRWWRTQYPQFANLLFHIPNGGLRNIRTAARLKKEGVVAGVADLFLAIPSMERAGLFIEMKRRRGGKLTEAQKQFANDVIKQGYCYALCHGWQEAADFIERYLKNHGLANKTNFT